MGWLLVVYHAVNIYTDLKWRITKNLWHLLFFMGGMLLSFFKTLADAGMVEVISFYTISVILWLFIGIIAEVAGMFSPGDTKMMLVSALWLAALAGEGYRDALVTFGFGLSVSLLITGLIAIAKKHGLACIAQELKSKLYYWLSFGLNPIRMIGELKALRQQVEQEKENPSRIRNIPGAIPIAAGTLFAILTI